MKKHYLIKRDNKIIYIKFEKLDGVSFKPLSDIFIDDGVLVAKIIIFKPEFIELVLKKKIKNKLNLYLNLILSSFDDDDSGDPSYVYTIYQDLIRYRSFILNRYIKYLDKDYVNILFAKMSIIEEELKLRTKYLNYDMRQGFKR